MDEIIENITNNDYDENEENEEIKISYKKHKKRVNEIVIYRDDLEEIFIDENILNIKFRGRINIKII